MNTTATLLSLLSDVRVQLISSGIGPASASAEQITTACKGCGVLPADLDEVVAAMGAWQQARRDYITSANKEGGVR